MQVPCPRLWSSVVSVCVCVCPQLLRKRGKGNSRRLNPNYHIRQRYQKLYRYLCECAWASSVIQWGERTCHEGQRVCLSNVVFTSAFSSYPLSIFRPELAWWRLVLMSRKLAIAVVAIMFSAHPMFQAR